MNKILIHTEIIQQRGQKIMFQIKLPITAFQVTGICVTVSPLEEAITPPLPPPPFQVVDKNPPVGLSEQVGSIQLMIPEKRDAFYADSLFFPNHIQLKLNGIETISIAEQPEWWFSGTKKTFFKVNVPLEDTIIEGFYKDEIRGRIANYALRVYLKLEVK